MLQPNEWVFLGETFDYDDGTMQLYKNGEPLAGFFTLAGDSLGMVGDPELDLASATHPRGINLGGSFPQNQGDQPVQLPDGLAAVPRPGGRAVGGCGCSSSGS